MIPANIQPSHCPDCGAQMEFLIGVEWGEQFVAGCWCPRCEKLHRPVDDGRGPAFTPVANRG